MSEPSRSTSIPWRQIDTVVFDCGDTIAHVEPPVHGMIADVLSELGYDYPLERIAKAFNTADFVTKQRSSVERSSAAKASFFDEFNTTLAAALGIEACAFRFNSLLQDHIRAHRRWVPKPGVSELLQALTGERRLFVLANWEACLDELLEEMGIAHFFDAIYTSEDLGVEKPDPLIFERFIERSGVVPHRAMFVGNEYRADIVGSRAHGFFPVLINPEWARAGGADCVVHASLDAVRKDYIDAVAGP